MDISVETNWMEKYQVSPESGKDAPKLIVQQHSASEQSSVLSDWKQLEERLNSNSLTTSSLWTKVWLNHYGDLVPHRFFVARQNEITRGICLLTNCDEQEGPFHFNSLRLGTAGEPEDESVCVEYNGLLVEDRFQTEFVRGLLNIAEQDPNWDQFDLDGFTKDTAEQIASLQPDFRLQTRKSRFFDLQQARESDTDIISNLGKSTRANIRRQLRKYSDLKLEWAESISQGESILSELIELHQNRWTDLGKTGSFASLRFEQFQTELMVQLLPTNQLNLVRVSQQGKTIGCLLLLVDNNRLLDYISGFAPFEKQSSPGLITHYLCMEEALRRGYDAYDFLVGEYRHKKNLSTNSTELVWGCWRRPRLKYRLVKTIRALRNQLSRAHRFPRFQQTHHSAIASNTEICDDKQHPKGDESL